MSAVDHSNNEGVRYPFITTGCLFLVQVVRAVYHRRNSETVQAMSNILELAQMQLQNHLLSLRVGVVPFFLNLNLPVQSQVRMWPYCS